MESYKLMDYIGKKRKVIINKLLTNDERLQLSKHCCRNSNKCNNIGDILQFKPNQVQSMIYII